jgi:hypothetical protein
LLKDAASIDCGELSLGMDSLADPALLDRIVRSFTDRSR